MCWQKRVLSELLPFQGTAKRDAVTFLNVLIKDKPILQHVAIVVVRRGKESLFGVKLFEEEPFVENSAGQVRQETELLRMQTLFRSFNQSELGCDRIGREFTTRVIA